jgi:hypothetical protein
MATSTSATDGTLKVREKTMKAKTKKRKKNNKNAFKR